MTDFVRWPLLLPGLHGTDALWHRFASSWGGPVRTVSYRADPDARLDDYVDQVEQIALDAGLPAGGVDLIAESFSGPVALAVVERQRIAVRRVVLIASFATVPHRWLLRAMARMHPAVLSRTLGSHLGVASIMANGVADAALLHDIMLAVRNIPPVVIASRLRVLADVRGPEGACACPVLALQAADDRLISASVMDSVRQSCTQLRVVCLAGPHLLAQACAEACAQEIRPFLS